MISVLQDLVERYIKLKGEFVKFGSQDENVV